MEFTLWSVVGLVAALLTTFSFVPQVRKMWRRRSVGDVSPVTMFQMLAGNSLWLVYGVGRRDVIIIGANVVSLLILAAGLVLYYRFREKKARGIIHGALLAAGEMGADPLVIVHDSSHGLVKAAVEAGEDPSVVARAAVEEAVNGVHAPVVHVSPEAAADAVARGAVEAAAEAGEAAARAVRDAVSDVLEQLPDAS